MFKILAFAGAALALGGVLAAVLMFGVLPMPFGPMAQAREAADRATPKPAVTVMYPIKDRVVNLSDKGTVRYLKAAMTLEFLDHKTKEPPRGDAVKQQQDEFAHEMAAHSAIIEDAVITTLSAKASTDLLKPDGKDQLKTELIERVNHALHEQEKVVNVYFTSFIIQ
ncbi:MAG: flagellar basal body-associated FliL family protein [Chloroflexota bacterium]|nr:flagellar basal body-associated FliL family protein [Chloroflexota bacterium]